MTCELKELENLKSPSRKRFRGPSNRVYVKVCVCCAKRVLVDVSAGGRSEFLRPRNCNPEGCPG